MSKKVILSIIVPVYNAGIYLKECLDSLVNQNLDNYEIICVNDGSTDDSLMILDMYKNKYKNLKIVNKSNGGVISARIAGYKAAKGEYIGWVDADDFVSNNMFKKLIDTALLEDADLVYCNYNFFPNKVINKQKWYKPFKGLINWKLILNNTIQWNKIVKKDLLDRLDITSLFEKIGEGCYGLVFINANKICSIDDCLYNYRVGHSSLSSNFKNLNWYKTVVIRSKNMLDYVISKKYDQQWIDFYRYRYLYYNLMLMIVAGYVGNKSIYLKTKKLIDDEKLFSSNNYDFLNESFSKLKLFYLKNFGSKSYFLMRLSTKILFK